MRLTITTALLLSSLVLTGCQPVSMSAAPGGDPVTPAVAAQATPVPAPGINFSPLPTPLDPQTGSTAPSPTRFVAPTPTPTPVPPAPTATPTPLPVEDFAPYLAALRPSCRSSVGPTCLSLPDLAGLTRYRMVVTLTADISRLDGRAEIRYTNREDVPLAEIYLHLFPNLWNGGMTVSNVRVGAGTATYTLVSDDDLVRVALPEPLQPGQAVELALDFALPIPSGRAVGNYGELAYQDGIVALAHFYPTVVVYDTGWRLETPSGLGDVIYHDASLYDVTFIAPDDLIVVATGATLEQRSAGQGMAVWRLTGGPMRDFNIVASRRFRVVSTRVGDVTVNSYFPPDVQEGGERALAWAAQTLAVLAAEVGPYPYAELDVAATATLAAGVEYPGLVVIAQQLYGDRNRALTFESVVVHEVAHQWWYNVIGNDQVNVPWLDEALAQYGVYLYIRNTYGAAELQGFVDQMNLRWSRVNRAEKPIGLPVAAYDSREYSAIVYGRGPLFLLALRDRIGERAMAEFLRRYYAAFAWGIATTDDFRRLAEQVSGQDLGDLFAAWVYPRSSATGGLKGAGELDIPR